MTSICDERGQELLYAGMPISDVSVGYTGIFFFCIPVQYYFLHLHLLFFLLPEGFEAEHGHRWCCVPAVVPAQPPSICVQVL